MKVYLTGLIIIVLLMGCGSDNADEAAATIPATTSSLSSTPELMTASSKHCQFASGPLLFQHDIFMLKEGTEFVSCSVSDIVGSYSSSTMYVSSQAGFSTGACLVTADESGSYDAGYWTFAYNGSASIATYHDSTQNGTVVTLSCTTATD